LSEPEKTTARLFHLSDLIGELTTDAGEAAAARAAGRPRGPVTGLRALDKTLGEYLAPGLHVLQAAPGHGKSALALQIASDCQFPAVYVTAEMGRLELFRRLVSRQTQTFLHKLKTGELGEREAERLAILTAEKLPAMSILDGTVGRADSTLIFETAEAAKQRAGHVLVVIDSLQFWARAVAPTGSLEYDAINAALTVAANIAAELQAPVIAIAHRNRASNTSKNAGGLHASKGSGDVEYLSESVIDLTLEEEKDDARGEKGATVKILKNRHGEPGRSVELKFCGRLQDFRDNE
jgi:replicative DNA helicase